MRLNVCFDLLKIIVKGNYDGSEKYQSVDCLMQLTWIISLGVNQVDTKKRNASLC